MTFRRGRRDRHADQRGITLIELLVTISIMGVGFLSLLAAFSTIELTVGATTDDAQLTSLARQVSDVIESEAFTYVPCTGATGQSPTGITSYQTAIRAAVTRPSTETISVLGVAQADGSNSSHTVSGATTALSPINGCSAGPATGPDYGVQQIKFQVSTSRNSVTRIVYKRWN